MLGNAGGAKGPDFWCAFEDGEVVVIGDEPANTINDRRRRAPARCVQSAQQPSIEVTRVLRPPFDGTM